MIKKEIFKSIIAIIGLLLSYNVYAQDVLSVTLHVETAGTLSSLITSNEKYAITDLTLSGNLNGTDIRYIREMVGNDNGKLANLNLAEANIVSGGTSYLDLYYSHRYPAIPYYTVDNQISSYMFSGGYKSIILPNSVTSIAESAFLGCYELTSITIGASITSIPDFFHGYDCCPVLAEIIVSEQNQNYSSMNGVLFNKNKTIIICVPRATNISSYTIPNSVTEIGMNAFSGCTGLTSVTIPNSVIEICWNAFENCTGLTSVTIPESVTEMGWCAFKKCTGLTSVTIPNSVTSIRGTFEKCTGLTSVTIPNNVTSIQDAFSGCTGLTSITIPNSVTSIQGAFSGCTGLTSVTIPNSVTSIDWDAFSGCTRLTSVIIPNSVTEIRADAFSDCRRLVEIYSRNSTPPILDSYCFYGVDKTTCLLYVPIGSKSAYQSSQWGDFMNIIEKEPSSINTINKDNIVVQYISNGIALETKEQTPVSVYNLSGQIIHQSVINGNVEICLDKGVYILRVNNESEKIIVE